MEPLCSAQLDEPWPDWSGVEPMHPAPEEHLEQHDRDRRTQEHRFVLRGSARRPRSAVLGGQEAGGEVARRGVASARSKRARAALFAQWIVDNLPLPPVEKQSYIIDVAGGRGALSFHLREKHGRRCIVIDPRDLSSSSRSASMLGRTKRERRSMKLRGERLAMPFEQRNVSNTKADSVCCGLPIRLTPGAALTGVVRRSVYCAGTRATRRSRRDCRDASRPGHRADCRRRVAVLPTGRRRALLRLP